MRQFGGVLRAVVLDNRDPDNRRRVKIRFAPAGAPGQPEHEIWAPISTSMPRIIPNVHDEVLVAFEREDLRYPYVIGSLWNSADSPPLMMEDDNCKTVLCFRGGVRITLDCKDGQAVVVEMPGGQKLTLKGGATSVEMQDSNGNSVNFGANGIVVNAASKVTINAGQVELSASMVNVNAAMSKFSGVIQCDTLVSNSVVSASYSPGAGNIW